MKKFFDLVLVLSGLTLLAYGGYLLSLRHRPVVMPPQVVASEQEIVTDSPTRLDISSLALSLPIYPAVIRGGKWQTTSLGVSYLSSSPIPGETGNSVFYAHNWPNLFGSLGRVKPGDIISVYFGSRRVDYVVHYVSIVDPSDSSVYAPTSDSRLTLYTCTGFLDSKRLVVTALLAK